MARSAQESLIRRIHGIVVLVCVLLGGGNRIGMDKRDRGGDGGVFLRLVRPEHVARSHNGDGATDDDNVGGNGRGGRRRRCGVG